MLKPRNCTTIFLRERQEIKQFNWEFEQRRQIVIFSDTNVSHFRSLGSLPQRRGTKWMMPRSIVVNQPQVRFNNDSLLLATGVFLFRVSLFRSLLHDKYQATNDLNNKAGKILRKITQINANCQCSKGHY